MTLNAHAIHPPHSAQARISGLATLSEAEHALLDRSTRNRRRVSPYREFLSEGQPVPRPLLLLSGWACRFRVLSDGRRQILGFILPGDLVGLCRTDHAIASASALALTQVEICEMPGTEPTPTPGLAQAYALAGAMDDFYLLNQVTRLGRLTAYERIADLFLEMYDRMELAGLATDHEMTLPITQETLADALGLTSVHVNRTLKALRRDRAVVLESGLLTFPDYAALAAQVDHRAYRAPTVR
ncbi:MAG TPA: Crp/Fnr family transcriptional regulator [Sphingomonas sp.]|jgi:CRP-like cAMP-binding protein|uniref:Crp/Fnr family transcriptional regulator n=1 Tax=Sphingomonas sp. TaxID=28214 RepID=UPI002ED90B2C